MQVKKLKLLDETEIGISKEDREDSSSKGDKAELEEDCLVNITIKSISKV